MLVNPVEKEHAKYLDVLIDNNLETSDQWSNDKYSGQKSLFLPPAPPPPPPLHSMFSLHFIWAFLSMNYCFCKLDLLGHNGVKRQTNFKFNV